MYSHNKPFIVRRPRQLLCRLVCAASVALQGCALFRTDLDVPPPNAPLDERARAYEELKPVGQTISFSDLRRRTHGGVSDRSQAIILKNGLKVRDPRDLGKAVPKDSTTSRAIRKYTHHYNRAIPLSFGGMFILLGSLTTATVGVIEKVEYPEEGRATAYWIASGALLAGAVTAMIFGSRHSRRAQKAKVQAFRAYEQDLLTYLQLEEIPDDAQLRPGYEEAQTAKAWHFGNTFRQIAAGSSYQLECKLCTGSGPG